jgi:hypothetical protein
MKKELKCWVVACGFEEHLDDRGRPRDRTRMMSPSSLRMTEARARFIAERYAPAGTHPHIITVIGSGCWR